MSRKKLENVQWCEDTATLARSEVFNAFIGSLATSLGAMDSKVDLTWLMGTSAFAFRILVNEVMCPSAMSVFEWTVLLPEAVEQAGYGCTYITDWRQQEVADERKLEAQEKIIRAIDRGVPPIVWDIQVPDWGVIVGYDMEAETYDTLACTGEAAAMPFDQLGQREEKILSVTIPGEESERTREEIILRSLRAAVAHAEQREWMPRPQYQDGLPAFDLWARVIEPGTNEETNFDFADYYAGYHYSARCCAHRYLREIADGDQDLLQTAAEYERVASCPLPVWDHFSRMARPDEEVLHALADRIRKAKRAEERGIEHIKRYLATVEQQD